MRDVSEIIHWTYAEKNALRITFEPPVSSMGPNTTLNPHALYNVYETAAVMISRSYNQ